MPCHLVQQRSARAPSPSPCWRTSGVRESWGLAGSGFHRGSGRWVGNPEAEALGRGLTPSGLGANEGFETRGPRSRTGATSEKGVENKAPLPCVCVPGAPGRCPCPAGCGRAAGGRSRCSACGRRPGRRAGLPGKGGGGGGDGREDAVCVAVGFFHDQLLRFGRRWPRCGGRGEEGISLQSEQQMAAVAAAGLQDSRGARCAQVSCDASAARGP